MKKSINGKKIKRAAIKVIKRAIPSFEQMARKMGKQNLIDYISITKPDSLNNKIARKYLRILHGMSLDEIENSIKKYNNKLHMMRDIKTYYNGEKSPEDIMKKWGITSKSDLDTIAMQNTYDIPKEIGYQHTTKYEGKIPSENLTVMEPSGQRPFSNTIHYAYLEFLRKLKSKPEVVANELRRMYLMNLAELRPEYAAVVSYILNGGSFHDDFSKMLSSFNGSFGKGRTKSEFIDKMQKYKMFKAGNPDFKLQNLKDNELSRIKKIQSNEQLIMIHMKNKALLDAKKNEYEKMNSMDKLKDDDFSVIISHKDKFHPDTVGKADDLYERGKKISKINLKQSSKKIIRKIIRKKPVKKCRCI